MAMHKEYLGKTALVRWKGGELGGEEGRRGDFDRVDAGGVLRGERGDRGAGVQPERVEGAHVGLQAGVAAAVGAGDRKGGDLPPSFKMHFHGRGQDRYAVAPPRRVELLFHG